MGVGQSESRTFRQNLVEADGCPGQFGPLVKDLVELVSRKLERGDAGNMVEPVMAMLWTHKLGFES